MSVHVPSLSYAYPTAFDGWGEEEYAAIDRVVKSGRFTMGAEVEAFEYEFAAWHGMKHAIMVNSGSSANLIAVAALFALGHMRAGDACVVPALAWSTTYAPLVQHEAKLLLADCDATWNAERQADYLYDVRINRQEELKLFIACSILGNPCDEGFWARLAQNRNAFLIVDNCESIGAKRDGVLSGTRGIGNTFSFFYSHQLSAIEGGCVLTNDEHYARMCRMLRNHGWSRGVYHSRTFGDEYEFREFGYNVRPVEMHAAIAREQLKKLPERISERCHNWNYWLDCTKGLPLTYPAISGVASPFGIHFCVESPQVRTRLAAAFRANGIDCRPPVGGSFRKQPYGARWNNQATPNADLIHDTGIMIGNPPEYRPDLIDMAVKTAREAL